MRRDFRYWRHLTDVGVSRMSALRRLFSLGLPPTGLIGEIWQLGQRALSGGIDSKLLRDAAAKAGAGQEAGPAQ
jgi:hypothetical protein